MSQCLNRASLYLWGLLNTLFHSKIQQSKTFGIRGRRVAVVSDFILFLFLKVKCPTRYAQNDGNVRISLRLNLTLGLTCDFRRLKICHNRN